MGLTRRGGLYNESAGGHMDKHSALNINESEAEPKDKFAQAIKRLRESGHTVIESGEIGGVGFVGGITSRMAENQQLRKSDGGVQQETSPR
jgi:hypothetical protein